MGSRQSWDVAMDDALATVPKVGCASGRAGEALAFLQAVEVCIELVQTGLLDSAAYAGDPGMKEALNFLTEFFSKTRFRIQESDMAGRIAPREMEFMRSLSARVQHLKGRRQGLVQEDEG